MRTSILRSRTVASSGLLRRGFALMLFVSFLLAGCSGSGGATTSTPAGGGPEIVIKNSTFEGDLSVPAGATVTVRNEDSVSHSLTAVDKSFDTHEIAPGGSGSFVAPAGAGSYPFACTFHFTMTGTLVVTGS